MKTLLRLLFCGLLVAGMATKASAQFDPLPDENPDVRFQSPVGSLGIGQVWVGANAVNHGLGYEGSYFSGGVLLELGTDAFDGWWNLDVRGHLSERGNLFGNIGLVRGVYFDAMKSDLRASIWYDADDDKAENFGHFFQQVGISADLLNELFGIHFNGYIPVGTPNYLQGTSCFVGNNIVIPGIDSALQGFDAKVGFRPARLEPWAGVIDVGTYYYRSDLIDSFAGVTAGFRMQPVAGMDLIFQVNHDERFDTTGFLGVVLHFGGRQGRAPSPGARDAVLTRRNDHIVRFHRDPSLAFNPVTGAPYNVIHVNNTAAAGGDGSAETPYDTLALADGTVNPGNSNPNDVIFVNRGDGTTLNQNAGITLLNGQLFLGDGVAHNIPLAGGGTFLVCNTIDGNRPMISNPGATAVTLANGNTVAGFNIVNSLNAIGGNNTAGAVIRDNVIQGMLANGVTINNGTGSFTVINNSITNSGTNGVFIDNSTGSFLFSGNTITDPIVDAIRIEDTGGTFTFTGNTITSPATGINGVFITRAPSSSFVFTGNTVTGFALDNIHIDNATLGTYAFTGNTVTGAGSNGINVADSTTTAVSALTATGNTITGNAGVGLRISLNDTVGVAGAVFNSVISTNTINTNGDGIFAQVLGPVGTPGGPTMNTTISSNTSINLNTRNGIFANASSGATHNVRIANNLAVNSNGTGGAGGVGIRLTTGGAAADGLTRMTATIQNNTLNGNNGDAAVGTSGIYGAINGSSNLMATITNNTIDGVGFANAGRDDGVHFDFNVVDTTLNVVTLTSNRITGLENEGLEVNVRGNSSLVDVIGNTNTILGNLGNGVLVNTFDNSATRITLAATNSINNSTARNVSLNANDTSRLVGTISNNVINNSLTSEGIFAQSMDTSTVVVDILGNTISNNALVGARVEVFDGSTMYAFVRNNQLLANGGAASTQDFLGQIDAAALATAQLCLELTANNATTAYQLNNNSAGGNTSMFNFENGGGNTGPVGPPPGVITPVAAGTCAAGAAPIRALFP
jgi:hypothetical protein